MGEILLGLRSAVADFGLALHTSTSRFSSYRLLYALLNILVTSFLYPGGRLALVVVRVPTWGEDLVTVCVCVCVCVCMCVCVCVCVCGWVWVWVCGCVRC